MRIGIINRGKKIDVACLGPSYIYLSSCLVVVPTKMRIEKSTSWPLKISSGAQMGQSWCSIAQVLYGELQHEKTRQVSRCLSCTRQKEALKKNQMQMGEDWNTQVDKVRICVLGDDVHKIKQEKCGLGDSGWRGTRVWNHKCDIGLWICLIAWYLTTSKRTNAW